MIKRFLISIKLSILIVFVLFAFPDFVFASDCNEPIDCAAAADTARNPMIPLAGAAMGVVAAAISEAKNKKPEEMEESGFISQPCQDLSQNWEIARSNVSGTLMFLQKLRDYYGHLDMQYEIVRFKITSSALIDLGYIALSGMGKSLSFNGSMLQNTIHSALKGVFKEQFKQGTNMLVISPDLNDLLKQGIKGVESGRKKALLESLNHIFTQDMTNSMMNFQISPSIDMTSPLGMNLKKGIEIHAKELAKNLTKFVDLAWSSFNAVSGVMNGQKLLDEFKTLMSDIRSQIFEVETELETILKPAVADSLSKVQGCMQIHVDNNGNDWQEKWADKYGESSLNDLLNSGIANHLAAQGIRWSK